MVARVRGVVPAGLGEIAGVARSEAHGREVSLWIQGDINPVLRALADASVDYMVFPEAELEDIFLGYYQDKARDV